LTVTSFQHFINAS